MPAPPVEPVPASPSEAALEALKLEILKNYLRMPHSPVQVHIRRDGGADDGAERPPLNAETYCQLVRRAAGGEDITLDAKGVRELSCPSPELALGFREPKYMDVQPRLAGGTRQVLLGVGNEGRGEPDVILLILTPAQATDLALLLGGIQARFAGQMAVCGEATAMVHRDGRANVSFLCHGCRELAGYGADEVVVGITAAEARVAIAKIEGGRKR